LLAHPLRTDRVFLVFLVYLVVTFALIGTFRRVVPHWGALLLAHAAGAAVIYLMRFLPKGSPPVLRFLRDWYPVLVFPLLYKEVEVLAAAFGNWGLTPVLAHLESSVFAGHPSLYLSETLPIVALSEYVHFCYLAYVGLVPLVGGLWYFRGRRDAFAELLYLVSVTFAVSYLFYILFPVDSPFYLSPPPGEPLAGHFFYDLVHFVSARGGARGGAFPSSHVSISTVVLLVVAARQPRWLVWLTPIYVGLVFATVYGRFHYALDVVAGWALAVGVVSMARWAERARAPRQRAAEVG